MIELIKSLTTLDYIVFSLVLFFTIGFVLYGTYRENKISANEKDHFLDLLLMGRKLTLPMFIATLVATWYGGIYGVAEIAYSSGIYNFVTQGFFWYVTYLIFAFFLVDKIAKYKAVTLPDLVGRMYGPKSEKFSAIFNILNLVPVAYCISIGLFIKMLFGFSLETGIISGVALVLCYSLIGGFRSVVFSDILQFFVMTGSVILVFILSMTTYGLTPLSELPETYFNPLGTSTIGETLAWGFIALGTLVDPNFYQRCFAAKNSKTAKKGILFSTLIWIVFDLSLTFGAMYAKAIMPEAPPSEGYFMYALSILPNGLRGFFLAGICATILSTLDSYLFLAGTTLSYDLLPKKLNTKQIVHRLSIILIGVIAVILSFSFDGNIKNVWKALGSISTSALLVPIMWGHISKKKLPDTSFLVGASFGAITTVWWRLSGLKYDYNLDEIYIGVLSSFLGILIMIFRDHFNNSDKTDSNFS